MRTFVIVFTEPSPQGAERVVKTSSAMLAPPYELVPDTVYITKSPSTCDEIARAVGIKGEDRVAAGVVFKLGAGYAGFTKKTLWEWLDDDE